MYHQPERGHHRPAVPARTQAALGSARWWSNQPTASCNVAETLHTALVNQISMFVGAGGKLSHHVLTSYVRAIVAVIDAQFIGKQVQG